jgi:hypothetical protein
MGWMMKISKNAEPLLARHPDRVRCFAKKRYAAIKCAGVFALILCRVLAACGPTPLPTTQPSAAPTESVAAATETSVPAVTSTTEPTATLPAIPTTVTQPPGTPTPPSTAEPTVTAAPVPSPTVSGAFLTLEPDTGPPGTTARGSGYLPGGPSAEQAKNNFAFQNATVCWGECPAGLSMEDVPVQWSASQPGEFTLDFTVPAVPWLAADGAHPLVPGDYTVGVLCLAPAQRGCLLGGPQVAAVFHLVGPTPSECKQGPCGQLQLIPPDGVPGTLVQVERWAPLNDIIDNTPFGYSLLLESSGPASQAPQITSVQQALDGSITGSFRVPLAWPGLGLFQPGPYTLTLQAIFLNTSPAVTETLPGGIRILPLSKAGAVEVLLAPATLTIAAAPAWTSLGQMQPLVFQDSARLYTPAITFDPVDSKRIAYCAPGNIQLSTDGGTTWSPISTAGAVQVASTTDYPFFTGGSPGEAACHSVTLDPNHPDSFYAIFQAAKKPYGAPPIFFIGYLTTDAGKTWQVVPQPQGYTIDQFGGFRAVESAVQALFAGQPSGPEQAPPFVVGQTTDGGRTWAPADLTCPASGPCIRWGAAPSQIGGMGAGYPQAIETSTDGGQTWTTPAWPTQVTLNFGPSQLAALSDSTVALLSPGDDYPFRVSRDAGQTWEVMALPTLIGGDGNTPLYPALQMLPNGTLLAQSQSDGTWQMLLPGASHWCAIAGTALPSTPDLFITIGDRLWWLESSDTPNGVPTPKSVLGSDLHCGP